MAMPTRLASIGLLAIALALLFQLFEAAPAHALTICVGQCGLPGDSDGPITPGNPFADEIDLAELSDLATTGIDGLVLQDERGLTLNVIGDVVVHLPSGALSGTELTLCAGSDIDLGGSLTFSGDVNLGSAGFCGPFETEVDTFMADVFHLTLPPVLTGSLEIFASGSIISTTLPVPEPGTASLLALGLVALARRGRRQHPA